MLYIPTEVNGYAIKAVSLVIYLLPMSLSLIQFVDSGAQATISQ